MSESPAEALALSRRFLTVEDVQVIRDAVQGRAAALHRPPVIVDLGAGSGTTALAALEGCPSAIIVTADLDPEAIHWAETAVRNAQPNAHWRDHLGDAAALAHFFADGEVDVLLHDAGHERADVERDLAAWLPKLAPLALIWVHDYRPPPPDWGALPSPGVRDAIEVFVARGQIVPVADVPLEPGLGWLGLAAT